MADEKKTDKTVDRSDYFMAVPDDFIFHGKSKGEKEDN